jgi:hypothetical protein
MAKWLWLWLVLLHDALNPVAGWNVISHWGAIEIYFSITGFLFDMGFSDWLKGWLNTRLALKRLTCNRVWRFRI